MATWTSRRQPIAPALLVAGLIAGPVGLDLQQGLWLTASEAYARGSSGGGPGEGGPGDGRGDGLGGRGGAGEGTASAARGDALGGRGGPGEGGTSAARGDPLEGRGGPGGLGFGGPGGRGATGEVGRGPARERAMAVARERYNRALGVTAQVSVEASATPGQGLVTDEAVVVISAATAEPAFFFGEPATEALIRAGWVAPQVRSDRALADHGQKVTTYVAIATALGHPAYVGVMQANFGSDGPGRGPAGDWQDVNLDLNGDGIVDEHDFELARQRQVAR